MAVAVAGAGAGAEIMVKVRAGKKNFGSATLNIFYDIAFVVQFYVVEPKKNIGLELELEPEPK